MGGNVTGVIHETGEKTRAERVNLKEIKRTEFRSRTVAMFTALNNIFKNEHGKGIWAEEEYLYSNFLFNGSTSFIMNNLVSDEEILNYKPIVGDIDIAVPEELKEYLWVTLRNIEGKEITPGIRYMGSNKPTISSIGEQINSVFEVDYGSKTFNVQVDFEFLPFENTYPTEWSRFSHSSSIIDARNRIKAVHHKYLIRALVGGTSVRKDIVIGTNKCTADNIKISKSVLHAEPRMLKFSVRRGVRIAYEPLIENGEPVFLRDKQVYKEIDTADSEFVTDVDSICEMIFGEDLDELDFDNFWSFTGIVDLMKKYLTDEQIELTHKRYVELLWGYTFDRGQELEINDMTGDLNVKNSGYQHFIRELGINDYRAKYVIPYYATYGKRGSKGDSK